MDRRKTTWLLATSCAMTVAAMAGLSPAWSDWVTRSELPVAPEMCTPSRPPTRTETIGTYPNFRALVHQTRAAVVEVLAGAGASVGSGFIIRADGLILTNAAGIGEARSMVVRLNDRREFEATVLGVDTPTDLAVLRINATRLPTVSIADASPLMVGEPVLAMGAALDGEGSASQGIVGSKIRSSLSAVALPLIQTDALTDWVGTGGPLLDGQGAVVGLTVHAIGPTDSSNRAARALPIGIAMKVVRQIEATGRASHPRLGVTVKDMSATLARAVGMEQPQGAFVTEVAAGGSEAQAGLVAGDVITAVDTMCIVHVGDLSDRLAMALPGETMRLMVWRNHRLQLLVVVLGDAVGDLAVGPFEVSAARAAQMNTPLQGRHSGTHSYEYVSVGFLAASVAGLHERAGLLPDDVLLAINGIPVNSIAQAQQVMLKHPRAVEVLVQRKGERLLVPLELT
jgi:serine protease Do